MKRAGGDSPSPTDETNAIDRDEQHRIAMRRKKAFGHSTSSGDSQPNDELEGETSATPDDLVGLAISGGGLRSALFNEGFLQALSHRGLLRYADYICSVSGGGYIASRLMTYLGADDPDGPSTNFHEDSPSAGQAAEDKPPTEGPTTAGSAGVQRHYATGKRVEGWHLGRDPASGAEYNRMPQIGGYLNRTISFTAGYILRQFPIWLMYISMTGIFATCLALLFRSYDRRDFRAVFSSLLGIEMGSELLIAFLPTLMALAITLSIAFTYRCFEYLFGGRRELGKWGGRYVAIRRSLASVSQAGLIVTLFFALTSVAIFLGNGITNVSSHGQQPLNLNYFATYIALAAGAIQILVFMGWDRLFRSEQSQSSPFQKAAQNIVAYGVVGFLVFSMIHWMGRENISGYVDNRDPFLLSSEVRDWDHLAHVCAPSVPAPVQSLDLGDWAMEHFRGLSEEDSAWNESLVEHALPPSPLNGEKNEDKYPEVESLSRIWLAIRASYFSRSRYDLGRRTGEAPSKLALQRVKLEETFQDDHQKLDDLYAIANVIHQQQNNFIDRVNNELMPTVEFTNLLCGQLEQEQEPESAPPSLLSIIIRLFSRQRARESASIESVPDYEQFQARLAGWPSSRRSNFLKLFHRHEQGELQSASSATETLTAEQVLRVALNRDLLELVSPGVVVAKHQASTPVVQNHDQLARERWLIVWCLLFAAALLLTIDRNRLSALFIFYRNSIAQFFLFRSSSRINGETPVRDLRPETRGLPFPIYLAAWLKLDNRFANFVRSPRAIAISPSGLVLRDGAHTRTETWLDGSEVRNNVLLADAVAISGAAVTPQMTRNMALALLMDFFGMRLGQWLELPDQPRSPAWKRQPLATFFNAVSREGGFSLALSIPLLLVSSLALYLAISRLTGEVGWVLAGTMLILALLSLFSVGYPGFLKSIVYQMKYSGACRETRQDLDTVDQKITECWPYFFAADGGFVDFLGVSELLRRRCSLIVVSDAGVNSGLTTMESLAKMCESAAADLGVRFIDMDHDSPIDFGRLSKNEQDYTAQPYMAMRVIYPATKDNPPKEGLLFYCQMAITEQDPVEIQQIRYRFPSFPDEPTTNQFYTEEQVHAYRHLGFHIGNRLCRLLERWSTQEISLASESRVDEGQPLFQEVLRRLKRGYLQTCYEEYFHDDDDVYGESIWRNRDPDTILYPAFDRSLFHFSSGLREEQEALRPSDENSPFPAPFVLGKIDSWVTEYFGNRDVMIRYMDAIDHDINALHTKSELSDSSCQLISDDMQLAGPRDVVLPCHYAVLAIAAQQLHRGTTTHMFQVGGRDKLKELSLSLYRDAEDAGVKTNPTRLARAIVHEISELGSCVFQSAEELADMTFVHCFCKEWVSSLSGQELSAARLNQPKGHDTKLGDEGVFDLRLDFRQLLMDALRTGYRSQIEDLVAHYLWMLAMLAKGHYAENAAAYRPSVAVELSRSLHGES